MQLFLRQHTRDCYFYRPQRSWNKVMFLQASVILSTGGGVCLSACWDTTHQAGTPLLEQTPPRADTPTPREQTPLGRHPPTADTPPEADCPGSRLRHTVNEWPVPILLECILVTLNYYMSGMVNSKSFVSKVLLQIKRKFKLTYAL